METDALPLHRGSVDLSSMVPHPSVHPPPHVQSDHSLAPTHENPYLIRRVRSVQDTRGSHPVSRLHPKYGTVSHPFGTSHPPPKRVPWMTRNWQALVLEIVVNGTSGMIAFLLSSTLAVSCASVLVGHGTPLAPVIARFIDMNLLGTAILSIVLAWKSHAPWTLGSIDVFVAPIMAEMAAKISTHLQGNVDIIVPTTIIMVALTSILLGLVFFAMGWCRVTSIANYMPYPVIAGFLSGIGAELMKNGVHMASSQALSWAFFSVDVQRLLLPAILFALFARIGQYYTIPVAFSFPLLLLLSLVGFHGMAYLFDVSLPELGHLGWVFAWDPVVVSQTPMWYPWATIAFDKVAWRTVTDECLGFFLSLVILGVLKYSVATTSLSTLFGRDISPDNEMRVIGLANILSGLLGCCGGCHYLSAMGIMKQFEAHEKVPALLSACLVLGLWVVGIRVLQYVPKFIFGGLLLSVGLHFLEAYLVTPFQFLKKLEQGTVLLIALSFLSLGMLESVAVGSIISMGELIYRIHAVGCVHHETTGALSRSAVDRTPEQVAYLDEKGGAIFVLRLQGYLFFGTSVNILERIDTRVQSMPPLAFVIIDLGLVPSFDATALLNFRKASTLAALHGFELYFCGLRPKIERALRRNPDSTRVHFLASDVDRALEMCENQVIPATLTVATPKLAVNDWNGTTPAELWHRFLAASPDETRDSNLVPLATYLEVVVVPHQTQLLPRHNTYFICLGYLDFILDTELEALPGIRREDDSEGVDETDDKETTTMRQARKLSLGGPEKPHWTPFTSSKVRLLKIGPGSVITPNLTGMDPEYKYFATSDCLVLRLRARAMDELMARAPQTALAVLQFINRRLASRFRHSSKRVSQMSSLLYK